MPTYSYACTDCGHQFDIRQAFSDDALTVCPQCAGKLRKVFYPVGVVFKGPGFYRTDAHKGPETSRPSKSETPKTSESAPAASSTSSPASTAGAAASPGAASSSSTSAAATPAAS